MSAHTPGPWQLDAIGSDGTWECWQSLVDGHEPFICECAESGVRRGCEDESLANARLIAAAPDMLQELKRLLLIHGSQFTADVIAKATG